MEYIIPKAIDADTFYDPVSRRSMVLKRSVRAYRVYGDHGDYCYSIKEFDIWSGYAWDESEVQRGLVTLLFDMYDSPAVYDMDNYKKFRTLIDRVDNHIIC